MTGDIELRLAFPVVYDGTTTQGLSALRTWMPYDWPEAMSQGRATHPTPTRESKLTQLLERGSTRVFPLDPGDMPQAGNRRSALAHLHDTLPPVVLGALTERGFQKLVRGYREDRGDLSSAMISAHITELRFLIAEAREEAGLGPLPAPQAASGRQGRQVHRPMASLEEVGRILLRAPRDVRVLVALLMATSASPQHLLGLSRGALDLDAARIRVDTCTTRRPDSPAGHMLYGVPRWCTDLLRKLHPDIDSWPDDRLLFPSRPHSRRPRKTISAIFRLAADDAGCLQTRLPDIRRLSQGIHAHAPRAVRRATATSRRDVAYTLGSRDACKVADAQETYAAWVVQHWTHLMQPPVEPRRPPRRAMVGIRANEPERPWTRKTDGKLGPGLPGSCLPIAPRKQGSPVRAEPAPPDFVGRNLPITAVGQPMDAMAVLLQAETFGRLERRAHAAEHALAEMARTTIPKDEAYVTALLLAMAAFGAGMTVEAYLLSQPALSEKLGETARLYAMGLLESLMDQTQGVDGQVQGPP